ncbi:formate dehydrogenase accessory sulfurtransferase FdhD [Deinococcus pimensis]|uniref:formate dehydrogenase accessory sulfurtransferase FdhD n=1 Tax=Deinococcus pimensis TaxID=309888 RepID=UPI00047FBA81|nr:formate dehydrogenase accessory sulfurtransferase FdhD [Deinococcus pimensis]
MRREVVTFDGGEVTVRPDDLAREEPLELRLVEEDGPEEALMVTMRTPGHDGELVLGLLRAEGVISGAADVLDLRAWSEGDMTLENVVRIRLRDPARAREVLVRAIVTGSACGVCGSGSVERLALRAAPPVWSGPPLAPDLLCALPVALREGQALFGATGALHGAGLFDASGRCLVVREDVGRHNAVDKVVGWALARGLLPLSDHVLVVSGRVGFEITQKALVAGVAVVCAVSAPSSLAVEVALGFGVTLVGFVRGKRFNVYAGAERVALGAASVQP